MTSALFGLWPIRQWIAARFERPLAALIREASADPDGLDERLTIIERGTGF